MVAACGANATAYIPIDASAKCESVLLTHEVFLQDSTTLCCFYVSPNRKLHFLSAHVVFMDFFAVLQLYFSGSYHGKQVVFLELWGLGTALVARLINGACSV